MFVATHRSRRFDYVPRLDERNNNYLIRNIAADAARWDLSQWWTGGPVLDQGREGACVGFGVSGEAAASPIRVQGITNATASAFYRRCKEIDEWEGVDYEGTSVRAGMMVHREKKWSESFYWAKSLNEVRQALVYGPVVLGIEWREGMYETKDNGDIDMSGEVVGGHCVLITGYSRNYAGRGQRFRWRNSWGMDYGINGNGYPTPEQVDELVFKKGGEAAVAMKRGYGLAA